VELRVEMGRKEHENSKIVKNLINHTKTLNAKLVELREKEAALEELERIVDGDEQARGRQQAKRRRVMLRGLAARSCKTATGARFGTWKAMALRAKHEAELGRVSKQFEKLFEMRETEWRITERTKLKLQGIPGHAAAGGAAAGGTGGRVQQQQQPVQTAGWEQELESVLGNELSAAKAAIKQSTPPQSSIGSPAAAAASDRRPSGGWLW
jgi:hypothetical protein